VWLPRVVIEYRHGLHVGDTELLYFGGAKKTSRAEADAATAPYRVGETARVYIDPRDPAKAIIERRFAGSNRVWPPVLPMIAAGWLGVACFFRPPNRPRDAGNGTLEWSTQRVRVARLLVDGTIGFSFVAATCGSVSIRAGGPARFARLPVS
jgi:hypothetical protein